MHMCYYYIRKMCHELACSKKYDLYMLQNVNMTSKSFDQINIRYTFAIVIQVKRGIKYYKYYRQKANIFRKKEKEKKGKVK